MNNGYSICLNEWIFDPNIKGELGLLLHISGLTAETGFCYAGNEYFAKKFGVSKRSIITKIKKLEQLGYIKISYKTRGAEIIERKICLSLKSEGRKLLSKKNGTQSEKVRNTSEENFVRTSEENFTYNNIMNNNNNNNNINYFKDNTLNNSFLDFIKHRQEIKSKMTDLAIDRMVKKIEKWQEKYTNMQIVNFINESIANGRKGIFEGKIDENAKKERTPEEIKEMLEFAERLTS